MQKLKPKIFYKKKKHTHTKRRISCYQHNFIQISNKPMEEKLNCNIINILNCNII